MDYFLGSPFCPIGPQFSFYHSNVIIPLKHVLKSALQRFQPFPLFFILRIDYFESFVVSYELIIIFYVKNVGGVLMGIALTR